MAIARIAEELPDNVSRQDPTTETLVDPILKGGTVAHPERPPGPHHNRIADKRWTSVLGPTRKRGQSITHP